MTDKSGEGGKGTFGPVNLPVSKKYVTPRSLARGIRIGFLAGAGFLALYLLSTFIGPKNFVSGGPVSSNHATFEASCGRCHDPFRSVRDELCSDCHEKFGDPIGAYSPERHVLYRSDDPGRIAKTALEPGRMARECRFCHPEHRGRSTAITEVTDENCLGCHPGHSFAGAHPQFDFLTRKTPDDSTLIFTHVRHTRFVKQQLQTVNDERACLYCHVPREGGASFQPIRYEPHCGACHLKEDRSTPNLPIADPNDPAIVGVETLPMIQRRGGPLVSWAYSMNPTDFAVSEARNTVKKIRLVHRDPWILENLRTLRRKAFDSGPLGDLLDTDGLASNETVKDLGREAAGRLSMSLQPLRDRPEPEVRREFVAMTSLLATVQSRLRLPGPAGLSSDDFSRRPGTGASGVQRAVVDDVVQDLTRECRLCHGIRNASVARVQKDQRALLRADFDHRSHILDRACLECHVAIPMTRAMGADSAMSAEKELQACSAAVQNVPGIENCRECHGGGRAAGACVTCHLYHPDKSNRSNLMLTVN